MRTPINERQKNTKQFYSNLMNGYDGRVALVVQRNESKTNPNINRCQFLTKLSTFSDPVVVVDSVDGIRGGFVELITFISSSDKANTLYYGEQGFNEWLCEIFNFRIVYDDGLVIILERNNE